MHIIKITILVLLFAIPAFACEEVELLQWKKRALQAEMQVMVLNSQKLVEDHEKHKAELAEVEKALKEAKKPEVKE